MLRALVFGLLGYVSATITSCGTSQSVFKITSLSMTPEDPVPGDLTTMSIGFDAPVSVTAGTATYTLTLNGLPFSQQQDLCEATACPIAAGKNVVTSNMTIPSSVAGTITAKIEWSDAAGQELMCVKVKETLQSKALVVYDFVRPYSPHYLTTAEYVDVIEGMHFYLDSFSPAEFKSAVKMRLRGSSSSSTAGNNTATSGSTGTTGTNTTTDTSGNTGTTSTSNTGTSSTSNTGTSSTSNSTTTGASTNSNTNTTQTSSHSSRLRHKRIRGFHLT